MESIPFCVRIYPLIIIIWFKTVLIFMWFGGVILIWFCWVIIILFRIVVITTWWSNCPLISKYSLHDLNMFTIWFTQTIGELSLYHVFSWLLVSDPEPHLHVKLNTILIVLRTWFWYIPFIWSTGPNFCIGYSWLTHKFCLLLSCIILPCGHIFSSSIIETFPLYS